MKTFILAIAAVALAACAGNTNPPMVQTHAMTVDPVAIDHALSKHFGVKPLGSHPDIRVTAPEKIFSVGWHQSNMTGEGLFAPSNAGGTGLPGPIEGGTIYLSNQITDPARLVTVLCHEYVHVYQFYRLGMWSAPKAELETHAQKNHNACS